MCPLGFTALTCHPNSLYQILLPPPALLEGAVYSDATQFLGQHPLCARALGGANNPPSLATPL